MTRIANSRTRAYGSPLRAQQAEETRERILDATVRVMAKGLAFVSVPQVAREAAVSVPTVYRHFATKRDLLGAVYPHSVRRAGLGELVIPRSMDELRGGLRAYFERKPSESDRDRIARLLVILTASSALRQWRDQLGSSVEEAADDVDWVLRAVIASLTARKGT